ncbi:MAG: hypothetical protein GXO85_11080 [Chlorobi bacterium]|nr:hypothetical protein [Chlorobiota bacterium]
MLSTRLGVYTKWREPGSNSVLAALHSQVGSSLPKWLKVARIGNELFTYTSEDGVDWGAPLKQVTVEMDSDVLIGLAASSGSTTSLMKVEFSDIIVSDTVTSVGSSNSNLPKIFQLYQNHPNPFNPSTTIQYDLANSGKVSLSVYDVFMMFLVAK